MRTLARVATWPRAAASSALAAAVFAFLDVVDVLLCFVYGFLDGILEDGPSVSCYCHRTVDAGAEEDEVEEAVSDTLYERRSVFKDAVTGLVRRVVVRRSSRAPTTEKKAPCNEPRWSDCGCASCGEWRQRSSAGQGLLHVVVKEPPTPKDAAAAGTQQTDESEDAIFIHGFTSSSSFWTQTVFRESSSSSVLDSCRLFAVDILGFGRSPKPGNCKYRLKDHVDAIERSLLVEPNTKLSSSFHLVSHSMGCIIALALAARHPSRVKSITLVAPPYFPPCELQGAPSQVALRRLAAKKLWPPLLFGSAVMSWYEHIGRTVCFVLCRNHRVWEWLLKILTRNKEVDFRVRDLTQHTHHSAWHTMHNVICGGASLQDRNLEAVDAAGIPVQLVHGVDDQVVPVECSRHLKAKLPRAELRIMHDRDHSTVILGRARDFAQELRAFWSRSSSST
ncbi:hypothetical protein PR202_gb22060 [Eleusine coracana subsp. coracana]|uniref:AB hydrolase-1 domain-containing protein n=1 Tax=Eleusine coracana subsp. coracana TaxID=191504 RepID=A0AAV5FFL3_ELECO|nr:hypothetical protein QOZ80_7AG0582130 [Eleusine coracana subsp. coracana]GJN33457.1 hypothetical protein PR202_gb22060 [Eleusine coracana subsp. coracana]